MEAALSTAKARWEEASSSLLYWEGEAQLEESQITSSLWSHNSEIIEEVTGTMDVVADTFQEDGYIAVIEFITWEVWK